MCTEDVPTPWAGSRRPAGARHPAGKHVSIAARRRHAHQRGPRGGCHPRPCSLLQALPHAGYPPKRQSTCAATACRSAKPCTGCTTGLLIVLCESTSQHAMSNESRCVAVEASAHRPSAACAPPHREAIRLGPHNPRRNSQAPSQVQKHHHSHGHSRDSPQGVWQEQRAPGETVHKARPERCAWAHGFLLTARCVALQWSCNTDH